MGVFMLVASAHFSVFGFISILLVMKPLVGC